jgi:pimeloyl-ACP methyl ester carboxylesterase
MLTSRKPAGVGIGWQPPVYLKPGDTVAVSVTGLGTLTNRIADAQSSNPTVEQVQAVSHLRMNNHGKVPEVEFLTQINNKQLYYKSLGQARDNHNIVFVHGLGGSTEVFLPLIETLRLEPMYRRNRMHLFDLEGHGLSPTSPLSKLSIESFAEDLNGVFEHANISSSVTIIAHSMGCLIAVEFASRHPSKIHKLILIDAPEAPLDIFQRQVMRARVETARTRGMLAIANGVANYDLPLEMGTSNPLAVAAVRSSLLSQDPESYAKACTALAEAKLPILENDEIEIAMVVGSAIYPAYPKWIPIKNETPIHVLGSAGCWHVLADLQGVAAAMRKFLN